MSFDTLCFWCATSLVHVDHPYRGGTRSMSLPLRVPYHSPDFVLTAVLWMLMFQVDFTQKWTIQHTSFLGCRVPQSIRDANDTG